MSLLSRITRLFSRPPSTEPTTETSPDEHLSRHDRREAGRKRHHETGEPAWEAKDRLDDPPGSGKKNPDAAPEILGGE
jgi:hypothetical protein